MAVYPLAIKAFTTRHDPGLLSPTGDIIYASHVNELQDEVRALQLTLGVNAARSHASVDERIELIETGYSLGDHTHTVVANDVVFRNAADTIHLAVRGSDGSIAVEGATVNDTLSLQPNGKQVLVGANLAYTDSNNLGLRSTGTLASDKNVAAPIITVTAPSTGRKATIDFEFPSLGRNRTISNPSDGALAFSSASSVFPTNIFSGHVTTNLSGSQVQGDILRAGGDIITSASPFSTTAFSTTLGFASGISKADATGYPVQVMNRGVNGFAGFAGMIALVAGPTNVTSTHGCLIQMDQNNGNIIFRNRSDLGFVALAAADFAVGSARLLKRDIEDASYGLDTVEKLEPKRYQLKSVDGWRLGLIADDVADVVPEVVNGNSPETMTLNYNGLVPVLIKAVQELSARVRDLEAQREG